MSESLAQVLAVTGFEQQRCSASGDSRRALRLAVSAAAARHASTQFVVERAESEVRRRSDGAGEEQTLKSRAKSSF